MPSLKENNKADLLKYRHTYYILNTGKPYTQIEDDIVWRITKSTELCVETALLCNNCHTYFIPRGSLITQLLTTY